MKCFVTGATGFVGSHVARSLVGRGHQVAILVRPHSSLARLRDLADRFQLVEGSLEAPDELRAALLKFRPDAVAHLAWSEVSSSTRLPAAAEAAALVGPNVHGSVLLAELAADSGCAAWIGLGSQAELAASSQPFTEASPEGPATMYGACKVATRVLTEHLCAQRSIRFAWLRLVSAYGPGDDRGRLIPYLARELWAGRRPALGVCEQLWDYLFVEDAAAAVAAAVELPSVRGAYILASGASQRLRTVIEQVRDAINPALPLGFGERPSSSTRALAADPSRFCQATGWAPRVDLAEGIARTLAAIESQPRELP